MQAHGQDAGIEVGTLVQLRGLQQRPDLNGQVGEVTEHNAAIERWVVQLHTGTRELVRCRQQHLLAVPPTAAVAAAAAFGGLAVVTPKATRRPPAAAPAPAPDPQPLTPPPPILRRRLGHKVAADDASHRWQCDPAVPALAPQASKQAAAPVAPSSAAQTMQTASVPPAAPAVPVAGVPSSRAAREADVPAAAPVVPAPRAQTTRATSAAGAPPVAPVTAVAAAQATKAASQAGAPATTVQATRAAREAGAAVKGTGVPAAVKPAPQPQISPPPQDVLPRCPWRLRRSTAPPPPVHFVPTARAAGGWTLDFRTKLALDPDSILAKVWSYWASRAEEIASRHVREAFGPLRSHLHEAAALGPDSGIQAVLAYAGSDAADHEATLGYMQQLVREEFPTSYVAHVGPEDFKNLAVASRRICAQLMQRPATTGSQAAGEPEGPVAAGDTPVPSASSALGDGEAEEVDEDGEPSLALPGAGALDFADWHREQRGGLPGFVVLLIERTEAVPTEVLRQMLDCFGSVCADSALSLAVVLGLQQPPQSRLDLLPQGGPLVSLRLVDAICAFEAGAVCDSLLEALAEDSQGLPLSPSLLLWLREQFLHTRRSVTGILRALALMCRRHLAESPVAGALCPIDAGEAVRLDGHVDNAKQLAQVFTARLRAVRSSANAGADRGEATDRADRVAAVQIALWRQRVACSLQVWDAFLCAADPLARHEARLRRLCKLLSALWPQRLRAEAGGAEAPASDSVAEEEEAEQRGVAELVDRCLRALFPAEGAVPLQRLEELRRELAAASGPMGQQVGRELEALGAAAAEAGLLRQGLERWLRKVGEVFWRPLRGNARAFLLEHTQCQLALAAQTERQLSGTKGLTSEALLVPLGRGGQPGPAGDMALLWRLLQSTSGRTVDVADLWRNFGGPSPGAAEDGKGGAACASRSRRFGSALAALHGLGLFTARAGGGGGPGAAQGKFAGWRLHKRHFGRLWRSAAEGVRPAPQPLLEGRVDASQEGPAPEALAGHLAVEEGPRLGPAGALLATLAGRAPLPPRPRGLDASKRPWGATQNGQPAPQPATKKPRFRLFMG